MTNHELLIELNKKVGSEFCFASVKPVQKPEIHIIVKIANKADVDMVISYITELISTDITILVESQLVIISLKTLVETERLSLLKIFPSVQFGFSKKSRISRKELVKYLDC